MKENRESLRLKTDIPLGTELEPSWTPQNRFTRVFTLPYLSNPSSSSSDRPPSVFLFLSLRRQKSLHSNLSTFRDGKIARARDRTTRRSCRLLLTCRPSTPSHDAILLRRDSQNSIRKFDPTFRKRGRITASAIIEERKKGKEEKGGRSKSGESATKGEGKVWDNTIEESTFDPIQLSPPIFFDSFEREEKSITIFPARAHDCKAWPSFSNGKLA